MRARELVLVPCLRECDQGVVHILLRYRAFLEQGLTALINLLLRVHCFFRCLNVQLRFAEIFGHCGSGRCLIRRFRLIVRGFRLCNSAGQVLVLEFRQQLACTNSRAFLHVKLFDGSCDLRNNRRLLQGVKHSIGLDLELDSRAQYGRDIDSNHGFGLCLRFSLAVRQQEQPHRQDNWFKFQHG